MKQIPLLTGSMLLAGLAFPFPTFAMNCDLSQGLCNPLNAPDLVSLFQEILAYVVQIGAIILVMMIIFVGFQYITARGNPEKVSSAHKALLWTVVGGALLLGAEAIALVITATVSSL